MAPTNITNISLLHLKQALNELPDEQLNQFFITHGMWLEDPKIGFDLIWVGDEEDCISLYDNPATKLLQNFITKLNADVDKIAACKLDESLIENYCEDYP